ncbi:MAG: hypothetical protein HY704_17140 [Gemmatimonadetes bacterium]|nr:hypothetical protein [Gemmatimonadota bacterium]
MSARSCAVLVAGIALLAYANSLANGFAYDDLILIQLNDAVRGADWERLAGGPYWPEGSDGVGLYRPLPMLSYALDWRLWGGRPIAFHLLNLALHAGVSVLVFALLLRFAGVAAGAVGGVLFAIHPVHVEAVANVVGRAELLAALFYLTACLLYLWTPDAARRAARSARLLALGGLYFAALLSKESAVTLPAALVLLDAGARARRGGPSFLRRVGDELPAYALLCVAFLAYLGLRYLALEGLVGDSPHPALRELSTRERLLTALTLWPEYLRLLLVPIQLSSDYSPAVLGPARSLSPAVVAGALVIAGLGAAAVAARRSGPLVALAAAWFGVTIVPVSNILVPVGVLLAERTLYLPSVGLALAAAQATAALRAANARTRAIVTAAAVVLAVGFLARTVTRNPVWHDTDTMYDALIEEHPESYRALWALAGSLEVRGRPELAWRAFQEALALAPNDYGLLADAGRFLGRQLRWDEAERLLRRAIAVRPQIPRAYRILGLQFVRRNRPRDGLSIALDGLGRARWTGELWTVVAAAHAAAADLPAAIRAQRTALTLEAGDAEEWLRLAEYLEATGDAEGAGRARTRARAVEASRHANDTRASRT